MFDPFEVTPIRTWLLFLKQFITLTHESTDFLCNPGQATFRTSFLNGDKLLNSRVKSCFQSIPDFLNCTLLEATQNFRGFQSRSIIIHQPIATSCPSQIQPKSYIIIPKYERSREKRFRPALSVAILVFPNAVGLDLNYPAVRLVLECL